MTTPTGSPLLKYGDRVRIKHSSMEGRIVEWRGPLGPNGAQIYRIRIRGRAKRSYIEVREDQLQVIPPES